MKRLSGPTTLSSTPLTMPNGNRVLLLLDVQVASLRPPPDGVPASATVGPNIAQVLACAREAKPPPSIVHVRNTGDSGDPDEPNTPGWELVHTPLPSEHVIDKRKNNAFTGTKLGELVPPEAELVVIGLHSDFSLRASAWYPIPVMEMYRKANRGRSSV